MSIEVGCVFAFDFIISLITHDQCWVIIFFIELSLEAASLIITSLTVIWTPYPRAGTHRLWTTDVLYTGGVTGWAGWH